MIIREIVQADQSDRSRLRQSLWPGSDSDHESETHDYFLGSGGQLVVFVAELDGRVVGFLELDFRKVRSRVPVFAGAVLVHMELARFARTGRPLRPRRVRKAWARHGAKKVYLSLTEARAVADRFLPGATVLNHWLWRYTIVCDRPSDGEQDRALCDDVDEQRTDALSGQADSQED